MTDVREDIVTEMVTRLTAITAANGYRTTIDTVERGYRDPSQVGTSERPWIGVVPLREDYTDEPGRVAVMMRVGIFCYMTPSAATQAAVTAALSDLAADVRKALYASPQNLSVDEVIYTRVLSRQGTEGLAESAARKDATMMIEAVTKFLEEYTA